MKKLIPIILFAAILLSSCAQVITNSGDEVRLNRWMTKLGGGRVVALGFKDDFATFEISYKEKRNNVRISGPAFIDKTSIAIVDKESGYPYRFNYSIKENKLKISTKDGSLTLTSQR